MAEKIGLEAVFDTRQFDAGLMKYTSGLQVAARITTTVSSGINFMREVAIGATRRLGELAVNGLLRAAQAASVFSQEILRAAFDNSDFDNTLGEVHQSLVNLTRTNFSPLVSQLDQLVKKTAPAFLGVVDFAQQSLAGLASNSLVWGQNVITQFANGMWNGVSAVMDALVAIGNMITSWLAPGSPPRLLPDIDQWGTDAMNEWLGGWAKGDFDIFRDISSTLEALIRSTSVGGDDTDLIPRILGSREGIAQAVDELRTTGQVAESTIQAIMQQVGTADAGVRDYIQSIIALQAADEAVAEAQSDLNAIMAEYEALLKPIDDAISEIDEAQLRLTEDQEKSRLALILKDPNASASAKRRAALEMERIDAERLRRETLKGMEAEVGAAEEKLSAAEEARSVAADQVEAARMQLDMISGQNRLIEQQLALLDRLAEAVAKAAAAGGGGGKAPGPIGIFKPDTSWMDVIKAKILELQGMWANVEAAWAPVWERIKEIFQPTVDRINEDLIPAVNNLKDAFEDSMPLIQEEIGRTVNFALVNLGIVMPTIVGNSASSVDSLAETWRSAGDDIIAAIGRIARGLIASFLIGITIASGIIALGLKGIEMLFVGGENIMRGDWERFWADLEAQGEEAWAIFEETADTSLTVLFNLFDIRYKDIQDVIVIWLNSTSEKINDTLNGWSAEVQEVFTGIATDIDTALQDAEDFTDSFVTNAKELWRTFWDYVQVQIFDEWKKDLGAVQTTVDNFLGSIQGLWNWLTSHVFSFKINLPDLPDWAIPGSPTPFEMGLRGIAEAMKKVEQTSMAAFSEKFSLAVPALSSPSMVGGGNSSSYTDARQLYFQPNYISSPRGDQADVAVISALLSF